MAEIHNIQDLRAVILLENELLDVRNELRQANGYDPAMSLAENAKFMIDCARCLGDMYRRLRTRFTELKKEQENDKNVARSYPITGRIVDLGECVTVTAPTASKTVAWYNESGHSIADPFSDYHPSGESVSERLLGSTDGYGR